MDATVISKPNDGPVISMASVLDERELAVLCMIYREGLTEAEVGKAMGLHQGNISRIRTSAILKLRKESNVIIEFLTSSA